jgi:hypothetical protein
MRKGGCSETLSAGDEAARSRLLKAWIRGNEIHSLLWTVFFFEQGRAQDLGVPFSDMVEKVGDLGSLLDHLKRLNQMLTGAGYPAKRLHNTGNELRVFFEENTPPPENWGAPAVSR